MASKMLDFVQPALCSREELDASVIGGQWASSPRAVTERIFWLFIVAHVVVWTALPVWTQPNRPLDMVEMLFWGHGWQWGYHKHPPLPAWIAESVFQLSAGAMWTLYLTAQLGVATSFWAAWKLAQEFLAPWPALCASLLLEASVNYNLMSADVNNSIILQPLWALAALFLYRAVTREKIGYWLATGLCLGLGMLAKYDIAVLALAMLMLPVVNARARAALAGWGPYLALGVALLIFAPHVAWLVNHHFPTIEYALRRGHNARSWWGHVVNPVEFVLSQLLFHAWIIGLTFPLWRHKRSLGLADRDAWQRDFLLVICLAPLGIDLAISLACGVQLQSMWGAPMWTYSGVLLMVWASSSASWLLCRTIILRTAMVGVLFAVAFVGRNVALPHLRSHPSRVHFPGEQLARTVESRWREHSNHRLQVVAGPWWTAANVSLHVTGRADAYDFTEPERIPWVDDATLRRRGGVILWEDVAINEDYPAEVRRRFPDAKMLSPITLRWLTSAKIPPARFLLAIVPESPAPANIQTASTERRRSR
jgi:hypothetical protein